MKKGKYFVIAILLLLNGCVSSINDKKGIAEITTSSIGGYLAYQLSDADIFTTVLGSAGGLLLGGYIGEYLMKNDYSYYKQELLYVLDDNKIGSKGYWKNHKSGNEGVITIKDYFKSPQCRLVEHLYIVKNKPKSYYDTACRENNGSWSVIR